MDRPATANSSDRARDHPGDRAQYAGRPRAAALLAPCRLRSSTSICIPTIWSGCAGSCRASSTRRGARSMPRSETLNRAVAGRAAEARANATRAENRRARGRLADPASGEHRRRRAARRYRDPLGTGAAGEGGDRRGIDDQADRHAANGRRGVGSHADDVTSPRRPELPAPGGRSR